METMNRHKGDARVSNRRLWRFALKSRYTPLGDAEDIDPEMDESLEVKLSTQVTESDCVLRGTASKPRTKYISGDRDHPTQQGLAEDGRGVHDNAKITGGRRPHICIFEEKIVLHDTFSHYMVCICTICEAPPSNGGLSSITGLKTTPQLFLDHRVRARRPKTAGDVRR